MKGTLSLGIIGDPLGHSLSPRLHAFLLERSGRIGSYTCFPAKRDTLNVTLDALRKRQIGGFNVTVPHKQGVLPFCDSLSGEAQAIGAVNTVVCTPNEWVGHNTDAQGFLVSLPHDVRGRLPSSRALLLGNGGAARAVLYALLVEGVQEITVAGRNPARLSELIAWAQALFPAARLEKALLPALSNLGVFHLVVNATVLGMQASDPSPLARPQLVTLPPDALAYDLIYSSESAFLRDAATLGLATQDGLRMLVWQGLLAFSLWTGESMEEAFQPALAHLAASRNASRIPVQ